MDEGGSSTSETTSSDDPHTNSGRLNYRKLKTTDDNSKKSRQNSVSMNSVESKNNLPEIISSSNQSRNQSIAALREPKPLYRDYTRDDKKSRQLSVESNLRIERAIHNKQRLSCQYSLDQGNNIQ